MCVWFTDDEVNEFTAHVKDGKIVREEAEGRDAMTFDPGVPFEDVKKRGADAGWKGLPTPAGPHDVVRFTRK